MSTKIKITSDEAAIVAPLAAVLVKKVREGANTRALYADLDFLILGKNTTSPEATILYLDMVGLITEGQFVPNKEDQTKPFDVTDTWLRVSEIPSITADLPSFTQALYRMDRGATNLLFFPNAKYICDFSPVTGESITFSTGFGTPERTDDLPVPAGISYDIALVNAEFSHIEVFEDELVRTTSVPYINNLYEYLGAIPFVTASYIHTVESAPLTTYFNSANSLREGVAQTLLPQNFNYTFRANGRPHYFGKPNRVNGITQYYPLDVNTLSTEIIQVTLDRATAVPTIEEAVKPYTISSGYITQGNNISGGSYFATVSGAPTHVHWHVYQGMMYQFGDSATIYSLEMMLSRIYISRADGGAVYDFLLDTSATAVRLKVGAATYNLSAQYTSAYTGMVPDVHRTLQTATELPTIHLTGADGVTLVSDITRRTLCLSMKNILCSTPTDDLWNGYGNWRTLDFNGVRFLQKVAASINDKDITKAVLDDFSLTIGESVTFYPDSGCQPLVATAGGDEVVVLAGYRVTTYLADTVDPTTGLTPGIYRSSEPCVIMCGNPARAESTYGEVSTSLDFVTLKPSKTPADMTARGNSYWAEHLDTELAIEAQNGWTGGVVNDGKMLLMLEPGCCAATFSMWVVSVVDEKVRLECVGNVPLVDSGIHYSPDTTVMADLVVCTDFTAGSPILKTVPVENITIIDQNRVYTSSSDFMPDLGSAVQNYTYKLIAKSDNSDINKVDVYCGEVYITDEGGAAQHIYPLRINEAVFDSTYTATRKYHLIHPRTMQIHT